MSACKQLRPEILFLSKTLQEEFRIQSVHRESQFLIFLVVSLITRKKNRQCFCNSGINNRRVLKFLPNTHLAQLGLGECFGSLAPPK